MIRRVSRLALALLLVPLSCSMRVSAGQTPASSSCSWSQTTPLAAARSEFTAAAIGPEIYVAGGFGAGDSLDRFDTVTETWSHVATIPLAVSHPGVAALDGLIYAGGGYAGEDQIASSRLDAFDPVEGAWRRLPDLPSALGAFGFVAFKGELYVIGGARGHLSGEASGAVDIFDPATGRWRAGAALPTPREHLAVVATDRYVYAIGGRANGDDSARFGSVAERYDPATDAWTSLPPLPVARGGLSGVAVGDAVVVMGGETRGAVYADVTLFEPSSAEWSSLARLPVSRHGLASAVVDSRIYAIGGSVQPGGIDNLARVDVLVLDSPAGATP